MTRRLGCLRDPAQCGGKTSDWWLSRSLSSGWPLPFEIDDRAGGRCADLERGLGAGAEARVVGGGAEHLHEIAEIAQIVRQRCPGQDLRQVELVAGGDHHRRLVGPRRDARLGRRIRKHPDFVGPRIAQVPARASPEFLAARAAENHDFEACRCAPNAPTR